MFKKFYLALAVLILCMMPMCFAYTDTENHWAEGSIDSLSKIDILRGYDDGTFRPDNYITRAELITIVNRLLKNSVESTRYVPDNNSKDWYYAEVRKAVESGILQGDTDGKVRPNDMITREEAIVILHRAFSNEATENMRINSYSDAKEVSSWAQNALALFVKNNYLKGYEDNTIRPKNNITRAEVITLIDRLLAEVVVRGQYTGSVYGNLLVNGPSAQLTNVEVDGDLIIAEGTNGEMTLTNIIVNGNLVVRTPFEIPTKNFKVGGDIIRVYEENDSDDASIYSNSTYGMSFTTPEKAKVIELTENNQKINYRTKNLIVIRFQCDDSLLFKSFDRIEKEETESYDNVYTRL